MTRVGAAPSVCAALLVPLILASCGALGNKSKSDPIADRAANVIERSVNPPAVTQHLEAIQKLLAGEPAVQIELLAGAQRDAESSRLATARLRHALLLGTAGHAGFDPVAATVILKDILAAPATLQPAERALATIELQRMTNSATLAAETLRLRQQLDRIDKDQIASLNRRLQAEADENTRLRKLLDEARAKLDAIGKIETGDRRP